MCTDKRCSSIVTQAVKQLHGSSHKGNHLLELNSDLYKAMSHCSSYITSLELETPSICWTAQGSLI